MSRHRKRRRNRKKPRVRLVRSKWSVVAAIVAAFMERPYRPPSDCPRAVARAAEKAAASATMQHPTAGYSDHASAAGESAFALSVDHGALGLHPLFGRVE